MLSEETNENMRDMPPMYGVWESVADEHVEKTLNMIHDMESGEYETQREKLIAIHKLSNQAGLIAKFNKSFSVVLSASEGIKSNDFKTYKTFSEAVESFIKEVWHLREHTLTLLKGVDQNVADSFDSTVREMYDAGISYALIYKLRNYIEHHSGLPLRASFELNDQGDTKTIVYLDSNELIQVTDSKRKDIFNKKVKDYLLAHEKIEILVHIYRVYIDFSELVRSVFETKLINEEIAAACLDFIDFFLEPDRLHPALLLASITPEDSPTLDSFANVESTEFQLQYLCNVVKAFVNNHSYILPVCYSPSASSEILEKLPGIANIGSLMEIWKTRVVEVNGQIYNAVASQLDLDKQEKGFHILCDERIEVNERQEEIDLVIKCYKLLYKIAFLN